MTSHKVLIFDFDGTMADTAPMIRAIYTEMAEQNNWRAMTDEDYEKLRKGSLRQARKWAGIHVWQLPLIIRSAKKLMHQESEKVQLFPEVTELIRELDDKDYHLYVLSRNSIGTIKHVLERYGIQGHMQVLRRRKRTLGSKTIAIKRLLRQQGYDKNDVWMIGDEVRDIQAAHRSGIKSIAVTWGIQDKSILKINQPTHMVESVAQLRKRILEEK